MNQRGSWCSRWAALAFVLSACSQTSTGAGGIDVAVDGGARSPTLDAGAPGTPVEGGVADAGVADAGVTAQDWHRHDLGDLPDSWFNRDGASMVQLATGRVLMIGGWNAQDPWGPLGGNGSGGGGDRTTNEVWASDDLGVTWSLLLPHDESPPTSGPNARFLPGHTVGVTTYNGHAVLMGVDPNNAEEDYVGDVWQESNNGTMWTRVTTTAPTQGRTFFMCGTYKGSIYVMGGQGNIFDPSSALNDVWRSADGGVTWEQLPDAPWSPRGMLWHPVEHNGKLYVVGGALYAYDPDVPVAFNGVYAFDGTTWETILPDGNNQFLATGYHAVTSLDGRLWIFNGYDWVNNVEVSRAVVSDDNGVTWTNFAEGSGGAESHADDVTVASGRILRVSGSMDERTVHAFWPDVVTGVPATP